MGRHGTIAGRKSAQDARRAAMFTKYTRQIIVAVKDGGDPEFNASLRSAIDKAKAIGMPNDNINRAIKKGTGELAGESYEELTFEGYGPSGVAIIAIALTDNKNRTAAFVRSIFDKNGGNHRTRLVIAGSVGTDKFPDIRDTSSGRIRLHTCGCCRRMLMRCIGSAVAQS